MKRSVVGFTLVAVLAVGGYVVAQQGGGAQGARSGVDPDARAVAAPALAGCADALPPLPRRPRVPGGTSKTVPWKMGKTTEPSGPGRRSPA
jgi:hypothetical protein